MSDNENNGHLDREKLLKKHKMEAKELQGKIIQLKKGVNKDKKRKKEVQDEIESLEKSLRDRHAEELARWENATADKPDVVSATGCIEAVTGGIEAATGGIEALQIDSTINAESNMGGSDDEEESFSSIKNKKVSKAQKRRDKKAQASKEREQQIKEAEKLNKFSARNVEAEKIKALLKQKNLQMHEINPDGNCLYAALAHQLGPNICVKDLRTKAACFIRSNMDDFLPFITDPSSGDLLTPTQFEEYCHQLENTSAWGGQPELRALSQTLKRRIEVLQADTSPIIFGEEFTSEKELLVAYYRHYYGLGEHYNSVAPFKEEETEIS